MGNSNFVHETACVESGASLAEGARVWHFAHVRSGAKIGKNCSVGKDCYVDSKVEIGDASRIQNGVSIYNGVQIADSVFVGPHVVFTNDLYPRIGSVNWEVVPTKLRTGCSIGAGAVIRCGISIGEFSMIAAGAIVTKDVAPFTLAMGTPAQMVKKICACGHTQFTIDDENATRIAPCCSSNLTKETLALAESCAKI